MKGYPLALMCAMLCLSSIPAAGQGAAPAGIEDYLAQGGQAWKPATLDLRAMRADFVVAADGSGTHSTLQAALDALPASGRRHSIQLKKGTYRGSFCVRDKAPFTLYGEADPSAVVIVGSHYNGLAKRAGIDVANPCVPELAAGSYGTAGSAAFVIASDDVQLMNLTIANDAMDGVKDGKNYPPGAGEGGGAQGVALLTEGDRIQLENVHLRGHQDTLYVRRASKSGAKVPARVFVQNSLVSGDVDFIFGDAALVISESVIVSRSGRRVPGNGGHVLAPSTAQDQRYGFLVIRSRFVGEAGLAPGSISLGRAWDHGVPNGTWQAGVSPNGEAYIRDSVLGAHLGWWSASTSKRPYSANGPQANRFSESGNLRVPAAEREALADQDGWGAMEGGTRGGADAKAEAVFDVRTRAELRNAMKLGATPKIVRLHGRIDLNADDQGRILGEADFSDPAYSFTAYLAAYDPATWGKKTPAGPLEEARRRSARRQAAHVSIAIPPNTTIVGVGPDATLAGGMLLLESTDNVIVRNIHFVDVTDHFPAWDPNDNASGEWNSEYDSLSLRSATHVWVDHCSFADSEHPDAKEAVALGRKIQRHDGLLDITRQSNYITVSWNALRDHDKTALVGGSDKTVADEGKLKVTFHHNLWERVKERAPRVRFGQVHLFNNLHRSGEGEYGYSLGIGLNSRILSENNVWQTAPGVEPRRLARILGGKLFADRGSLLNGQPVDLNATLAAAGISPEIGWTPPYAWRPELASTVAASVGKGAGAGRLP